MIYPEYPDILGQNVQCSYILSLRKWNLKKHCFFELGIKFKATFMDDEGSLTHFKIIRDTRKCRFAYFVAILLSPSWQLKTFAILKEMKIDPNLPLLVLSNSFLSQMNVWDTHLYICKNKPTAYFLHCVGLIFCCCAYYISDFLCANNNNNNIIHP